MSLIDCKMSDARLRRVTKEIVGTPDLFAQRHERTAHFILFNRFKDCQRDKASHITIDFIDGSPFHLKGAFDGPQGTPYEGGRFEVVRDAVTVFLVFP